MAHRPRTARGTAFAIALKETDEELAPAGIEDRRCPDSLRTGFLHHGLQDRDSPHGTPERLRPPLCRRHPHPNPREGSGAGCDGEQFNITQVETKLREQALDHPEQCHRVVRATLVPGAGQALQVTIYRRAAVLARRIKGQDQHDYPDCPAARRTPSQDDTPAGSGARVEAQRWRYATIASLVYKELRPRASPKSRPVRDTGAVEHGYGLRRIWRACRCLGSPQLWKRKS